MEPPHFRNSHTHNTHYTFDTPSTVDVPPDDLPPDTIFSHQAQRPEAHITPLPSLSKDSRCSLNGLTEALRHKLHPNDPIVGIADPEPLRPQHTTYFSRAPSPRYPNSRDDRLAAWPTEAGLRTTSQIRSIAPGVSWYDGAQNDVNMDEPKEQGEEENVKTVDGTDVISSMALPVSAYGQRWHSPSEMGD